MHAEWQTDVNANMASCSHGLSDFNLMLHCKTCKIENIVNLILGWAECTYFVLITVSVMTFFIVCGCS